MQRRGRPYVTMFLLLLAATGAAAFAGRDALELGWLRYQLGRAAGGEAAVDRLRHTGDALILDGIRIGTPGNGLVVAAERVEVRDRGGVRDILVTGGRVTVTVDKLHADDPARLAALGGPLDAAQAVVHVRGASLSAARSGGTVPALRAGLEATFRRTESRTSYDVLLQVAGPAGALPLAGHGEAAGGTFVHEWRAAALPVPPFAGLLALRDLSVTAGTATAVQLRLDTALHLTATLDGVEALAGAHALHALAGPLAVADDGIGSAGLAGTLDAGGKVTLRGEVHGVGSWLQTAAIAELQQVARLFAIVAAQPAIDWSSFETTARGVGYAQYAFHTKDVPHVVTLLAVDPHEPTLRFDTALAQDRVISHGERTSDLAVRTGAIAGVNGDYFDIGRTYEPQGLLVRKGVLLHGPTDHYALAIDRANAISFALYHFKGTASRGGLSYPITQFNSWPARFVTVITPDYGTTLPAAPGMTFVALEPVDGKSYRVLSLGPVTLPLPVTFGLGFGRDLGPPRWRPGDIIELSYATDPPVDGVVAALSSGPLLLKDGAWFEDKRAPAPDERDVQWPVLAVGKLADGTLILAAVDGRHPERSIGMARPEFAELLRGYGVTDALALDSGGSVTVVARAPGDRDATVRNVPSDNSFERYIADALLLYSSAPAGTIVTGPAPSPSPAVRP